MPQVRCDRAASLGSRCAPREGLGLDDRLFLARKHDQRNIARTRVGAEKTNQGQPIDVRHHQVLQDYGGTNALARRMASVGSAAVFERNTWFVGKHSADRFTDDRLVVDQQNLDGRRGVSVHCGGRRERNAAIAASGGSIMIHNAAAKKWYKSGGRQNSAAKQYFLFTTGSNYNRFCGHFLTRSVARNHPGSGLLSDSTIRGSVLAMSTQQRSGLVGNVSHRGGHPHGRPE